MKTKIKTRFGDYKELIVKIWQKDNCLYCSNPLGDDRVNSANYYKSVHKKCQVKVTDNPHGSNFMLRGI